MTFNKKKYRITLLFSGIMSLLVCGIVFVFLWVYFSDNENSLIASSWGALVFFIPAFYYFSRRYRRRKKIISTPFPEAWHCFLCKNVQYYSDLDSEKRRLFQNEIQIFLAEKKIIGIETVVDDDLKLLVAASAVIPILSFPDWEYDNLSEVLIYPHGFNENFEFKDEGARILGMVGIGQSMVLSKKDLIAGFHRPQDKRNVGIHEFAHKLDGRDGEIDGIPFVMMDRRLVAQWKDVMNYELNRMKLGDLDIDSYGMTNSGEFFAVTSEYFFENPEKMAERHPELYEVLERIYKQDTKALFSHAIRSVLRPYGKKISKNDPCPCGSGKKFKNCCFHKKKKGDESPS